MTTTDVLTGTCEDSISDYGSRSGGQVPEQLRDYCAMGGMKFLVDKLVQVEQRQRLGYLLNGERQDHAGEATTLTHARAAFSRMACSLRVAASIMKSPRARLGGRAASHRIATDGAEAANV